MSRIIEVKVGALASSSANNIAHAQTFGSGGGTFTLNGSTAGVLDLPRRVLMTNGGNDTGTNFTITGTDWNGNVATEVLAGTSSSTAQSIYDYATVTSIVASGTVHSTGTTFGTNGVASSRPIFLDTYGFAPTALQVVVTGTVNATVQQSLDDPSNPVWLEGSGGTPAGYTAVTWFSHPDTNLVGLTGSVQGNYAYIPRMTRILLNSGSGSVIYSVIQAASPSI